MTALSVTSAARSHRLARHLAMLVLMLLCVLASSRRSGAAPKPATTSSKPINIPMGDLGMPMRDSAMLTAGATMYSVSFVDDKHVLVTFAVKRLMKRLADGSPQDEDRTIRALLLEIPSGTILGDAEWRVNDLGRYLFPIGHGAFLLRQRQQLSVITPMAGLAKHKVFEEHQLLHTEEPIEGMLLSPDHELLTVETEKATAENANNDALDQRGPEVDDDSAPPRVKVHLYRLRWSAEGALEGVTVAGNLAANRVVDLPITRHGYLTMKIESGDRWLFDFHPFAAGSKLMELSPFDSTCHPSPTWISPALFVSFGCFGSDDKVVIGGFDLTGVEMWQQSLGILGKYPTFATAPEVGRFALGRLVSTPNTMSSSTIDLDVTTSYQVRVFEGSSGRLLLQQDASPAQRSGQNYDLSPDGRMLVIAQQGNLMLYPLPAATSRETSERIAEEKLVPPPFEGSINFTGGKEVVKSGVVAGSLRVQHEKPQVTPLAPTQSAAAGTALAANAAGEQPASAAGAGPDVLATGQAAAGAADNGVPPKAPSKPNIINVGDSVRRKPPTLYGPDEKHPPTKQMPDTPTQPN